jgi:hypothetical protein
MRRPLDVGRWRNACEDAGSMEPYRRSADICQRKSYSPTPLPSAVLGRRSTVAGEEASVCKVDGQRADDDERVFLPAEDWDISVWRVTA